MIHVVRAEYRNDYKIWVEFDDGSSGVADLADILWGNMFEPLKDVEEFRKFEVSPLFSTIVWRNGADLAPEALYERAIKMAA
jgi:hypothetical protein